MQRIGAQALRMFKALAGQDRDEPMGALAIAVYVFLLAVAMMLSLAWILGAPMQCVGGATC